MQKEVLTGVVTAVATTFVLWGLGQTFGLLRDVSFSVEVPPGAVVAFDLEAGCPGGWSNVGRDESQRFAGRTFIVAGPRVDREPSDQTTLARPFDDRGGTEEHTMTVPEMPSHAHGSASYVVRNDDNKYRWTTAHQDGGLFFMQAPPVVGGSQPHNNMPPYIALYFCKKEVR